MLFSTRERFNSKLMRIFSDRPNMIILIICLFFSLFITINSWFGFPFVFLSNGQSYYSAFQGVFPWSDANGYFDGPKNFVRTGNLDIWNSRRPFTSLYYSSLNLISFNNFYIALIIRNILFSLALSSCLILIYKKFGFLTLSLTSFLMFVYSAIFIPTTLSEIPGLTLGCLSFSICWYSIEKRNSALFLFGLFLYCLALNARSGAFFILPLLLIYYVFYFSKDKSKIKMILLALLGITTILSSFLMSLILVKYYGDQSAKGIMQGNFSPTLYGLVSGGKGWNYAYIKFQNFKGNDSEFYSFLYNQSYIHFINYPKDFFIGLFYNFSDGFKRFLLFTKYLPTYLNVIITSAFLLCIVTAFVKIRNYNKNIIDFISLGLISYFISACFIAQDGGIRVFAVTIIFNFISISIALAYFIKKITTDKLSLSKNDIYFPLVLTFVILILSIILPGVRKNFTLNNKDVLKDNLKCSINESKEFIENASKQPYIYVNTKDLSTEKRFSFLIRNPYTYNLLIQKSEIEYQEHFRKILLENKDPFVLGHFSDKLGYSRNYIADKAILKENSSFLEICYNSKTIENYTIRKITSFIPAQKLGD